MREWLLKLNQSNDMRFRNKRLFYSLNFSKKELCECHARSLTLLKTQLTGKNKEIYCQRGWHCSPVHKMATLAWVRGQHWSGRRRLEASGEGWRDIHVQGRPHRDGTGNANNLLTCIDRHRLNALAVRVRCCSTAASRASLLGPLAGPGGGLFRALSAAPVRMGLAAVWQPWKPTSNCTVTVTV